MSSKSTLRNYCDQMHIKINAKYLVHLRVRGEKIGKTKRMVNKLDINFDEDLEGDI